MKLITIVKVFNNLFAKALLLALPTFILFSCNKDSEEKAKPEQDIHAFEQAYSNSLNYSSQESIKLIGYKKIKVTDEEMKEFNASFEENKELLNNYFYDKSTSTLRIYFPVEAALIEHHDATVEASAIGELNITSHDLHGADVVVVGRKQTEIVSGVEGNIIKDGIIYLAEKNKADHNLGNVYVFDFGDKMIMNHDDHHSADAARVLKASCMSNHGGKNCSNAFNIKKGRCTFKSNVCMDYNGWFTNCKNGKWSNFPGSDCDYALGAGHCWNEVM